MQLKKHTKLFTAIATLLLTTPVWATNGYFTHGIGTKNKGMAGSGLELVDAGVMKLTAEIIDDVNKTSEGWFEYFKHSHWKTFKPLDGWIRRRFRTILRGYTKGKGISRGKDNIRWPNQYFRDLGYFSLYDAHRALLQSS